MKLVEFDEWINSLKAHSSDEDERNKINNAAVLFKTGMEKLEDLGVESGEIMVKVKKVMGEEVGVQHYESLSNSEATRLLMVADYIDEHDELPTLTDIADYKTKDPTHDDVANEGRIINKLDEKLIVKRKLSAANTMDNEPLEITKEGEEMLSTMLYDTNFLKKLYNRSRNNNIREFLVSYIEQSERGNINISI